MQLPSKRQREELAKLATEHGCTVEIEFQGARIVISPSVQQASVVSLDANRAARKR